MPNPFRYFNNSPEVIRLSVMLYVRYPLSLRQVEDLLFERGINICHETVRFWWNRFGPAFAGEIRKRRPAQLRSFPQWRKLGIRVRVFLDGIEPGVRDGMDLCDSRLVVRG
ncbi:IS6 family transposase [Pelagibius litoralis]|uniref:IS6 family transposase n=1 Tax=Pelagibius litoralis TaxID=374515 RepID=UPI00197CBC14|nr:IS6 family transposase [Pelagibius litoralis]